MPKFQKIYLGLIMIFFGCQENIRKSDSTVQDEVVDISTDTTSATTQPLSNSNLIVNDLEDIIGYWVGDFRNAKENEEYWSKFVSVDEGLVWNRDNKINISINKLDNDKVYGHSVVAGNYRPFEGTYKLKNNTFMFDVSEPGDDRYDGQFKFHINLGDTLLNGTWKAFKKIEIRERVYNLQKKIFSYDPGQMLIYTQRYANWDNIKKIQYDSLEIAERDDLDDFYLEVESSTDSIYKINASNKLLQKQDVENLKRGDLFIIRNTIYARHGYSFRNRPLRVFFDQQPWYIPVHNDIKKDLTAIEKENIKLLMRYEKNAKAYYDTFGRG